MAAVARQVRRRAVRGAYWAAGARRGPRQREALREAVEGRVVLVTAMSPRQAAALQAVWGRALRR